MLKPYNYNINEKYDNKDENCKSSPQNKIISPKSVFETLAVINGISSFSVNMLQEGVTVLIVDDLNIQPVMVSKIVCTDTSAVIAVDAMSRLILIADRSSSFFLPSSSSSSPPPSLHPSAKHSEEEKDKNKNNISNFSVSSNKSSTNFKLQKFDNQKSSKITNNNAKYEDLKRKDMQYEMTEFTESNRPYEKLISSMKIQIQFSFLSVSNLRILHYC